MLGYLVTIWAGIFWVFRVVVTMMASQGTAFPVEPMNMTFEVVLLFIAFVCIILIAKRNMFGAIVYLISYGAYFGVDAYKGLDAGNGFSLSLFASILGIVIAFMAFASIGLASGKKSTGKNKKTDWFYGTDEYERQFDERADTNQYKL